ncbi:MAG TPA: protocatechuate 3,4-dioxygenase subunit alpha [Acidimicrobiales bacterium]|nr:protocatechuate 3,4-dioxygenase subunit alpha [Acidimicrobiales bacterium]
MPGHPTPSQTVGPFFSLGVSWIDADELVDPGRSGAVVLLGRVLDGSGAPVPDALVEIFQASPTGRFDPNAEERWSGFGRCLSDDDGTYRFVTVKPGALGAHSAPHIDVSVFARGLLQRVVTRCYFPDEPDANRADAVLRAIDDPAVRGSLVAVPDGEGLRFDIRLQGAGETAFFAW